MLDKKDLVSKYGPFKGLHSVDYDFDPVNNPSINPSILQSQCIQKSSSFKQNENHEAILPLLAQSSNFGPSTIDSKTGNKRIAMSQKINGKNVRVRDLNTMHKQNGIFSRFSKIDLESDKYFYPNPDKLIHPLSEKKGVDFSTFDTQEEAKGNINFRINKL